MSSSTNTLKQVCFALALFTIATSCCKAQLIQKTDPLQIVAKALLCFDNRTVITNCMATAALMSNGSSNPNSTFCHGPCFGHAMLMVSCLDGIFSNFHFYSPPMMQGVRAIFQVACGKNITGSVSSASIVAIDTNTATSNAKEMTLPLGLVALLSMIFSSFILL